MNQELNDEIVRRLIALEPLDDLGIEHVNGRLDLRGLRFPAPERPGKPRKFQKWTFVPFTPVRITGAVWNGLDLGGATLGSARLINCEIENCVFDGANCYNVWMKQVRMRNCSLRQANLREWVPAGQNAVSNFHDIDFTKADLRDSIHFASHYTDCTFVNTRLDKVEFDGSVFTRCRFEGLLREVIFQRSGYEGEHLEPNEMKDVDMSKAKLRWCEFRKLDLETIRFPEDEHHIVMNRYPKVLAALLKAFPGDGVLENKLRWKGDHQHRAVFHVEDLKEIFEERYDDVRSIIDAVEHSGDAS